MKMTCDKMFDPIKIVLSSIIMFLFGLFALADAVNKNYNISFIWLCLSIGIAVYLGGIIERNKNDRR